MPAQQLEIVIRKPLADDGFHIHQLIAQSPPLDLNSTYSYYLMCDHFRDSCVVAEADGAIVGFISSYRLPQRPDHLFVWQVVVDHEYRGNQIASRMLDALIQRFDGEEIRFIEVTVNPSNSASRALFERLASIRGTTIKEELFLEASAFGSGGNHESEILLRVPLTRPTTNP